MKIFNFIRFCFEYFIVRPIRKIYNYIFKNLVIPDNQRNQECLDYCMKVLENPTYQPTTIYERYFEDKVREMFEEMVVKKAVEFEIMCNDIGEQVPEEETKDVIYAVMRPMLLQRIGKEMTQYVWQKD